MSRYATANSEVMSELSVADGSVVGLVGSVALVWAVELAWPPPW